MENLNTITISKEEFEELLRTKFTLELLKKASLERFFTADDVYRICGWNKSESEGKE
jgi:hypothetical protein